MPSLDCETGGHQSMLRLATSLSAELKANKESGYGVHGLFGIFANGEAIDESWSHNISWLRGSKKYVDYQGVKSRFMYTKLCGLAAARRGRRIQTICEVPQPDRPRVR